MTEPGAIIATPSRTIGRPNPTEFAGHDNARLPKARGSGAIR
jgi:hypothetical protein